MDSSGLGINLLSSPFKTIDTKMSYAAKDRTSNVSTHLKDLLDMTRRNLDGLNSSINKSREREYDEIPHNKVNMYKFLEYNRPPTTSSYRVRLRDNYSMDGTPVKEYVPTFDSLPPKSPTPQPPQLRMTGGNEFSNPDFHQSVSHNLAIMAQNLQDKIELEFKSQMHASKEELLFMQKEMTDKFRNDLKRASECADNLQKLDSKFNEFKNETLQTLHILSKDVEYIKAENKELRNELKENLTISEEKLKGDKERNDGFKERFNNLENTLAQKLTSFEQKFDKNLKNEIEATEKRIMEMQERLVSDSKNQDMSLKSIVSALEEQSEVMARLKKELAKIMERINEDKLDQIKLDITKEYNQKFKRLETAINDDTKYMDLMNSQNDLMKKINKLNQQLQEVDEKGNKKSGRVTPVIDQDIEPRLEKKIDSKCGSLDQKIKSLEARVDDLNDQLSKINNESVMNTSQVNNQSSKKVSKRKKGVLEDIEEIDVIEQIKSKVEETKKKEVEPVKSTVVTKIEEPKPVKPTVVTKIEEPKPVKPTVVTKIEEPKHAKPTVVTKIEESKPAQSAVKVEEKKQSQKVDTVQKFEMPIQEIKEPQKQDKSQNFMDALDSSFGEDSHGGSESDGFESSKGGVNYYDFSSKPPNNPVQAKVVASNETELDRRLKNLREDQKASLINSIVEEEIKASLAKHSDFKESRGISVKQAPAIKENKYADSKITTAPKQNKAFEYKGVDTKVKRPDTKGVGLGGWDVTDNFDESENSDFNQSAEIQIANDNKWGTSNKNKREPKIEDKPKMAKKEEPKKNQGRRGFDYGDNDFSNDDNDKSNQDDDDDDDDWGSFDLL